MTTKRLLYLLRLIAKGETPGLASRRALMARRMAGTKAGRWVLTQRGSMFLYDHGGGEFAKWCDDDEMDTSGSADG